jgi:hypothetical protein
VIATTATAIKGERAADEEDRVCKTPPVSAPKP